MTALSAPSAPLRCDSDGIDYLTLHPCEIDTLGNMHVNRPRPQKIFGWRPGKWEVRLPMAQTSAVWTLHAFDGRVATLKNRADGKTFSRQCPYALASVVTIDEPADVVRVGPESVDILYRADNSRRTLLLEKVPAGLKTGRVAGALPAWMARPERLRIIGITPQKISAMTAEDYAAEGIAAAPDWPHRMDSAVQSQAAEWRARIWTIRCMENSVDAWAWAIRFVRLAP